MAAPWVLDQVRERLDAEPDVALLVARDVAHALEEPGQQSGGLEMALEEMLPRLCEGRLDDHVVEHHAGREPLGRGVELELAGELLEPPEHPPEAPRELAVGGLA